MPLPFIGLVFGGPVAILGIIYFAWRNGQHLANDRQLKAGRGAIPSIKTIKENRKNG